MHNTMKEAGYVYILTNPSFKEDWVKIGKSSRPVDIRSKELDNTAVPLPFEIYATLKTVKYEQVEKLIHKTIDRLTDLRIRQNREFFNVAPAKALDILKDISTTIDDAEIEEVYLKRIEQDTVHAPKRRKKNVHKPEMFYIKAAHNANAVGCVLDEGFKVLAGSVISDSVAPSMSMSLVQRRQELMNLGIVDTFSFKTDYIFNSPSTAAAMVLGRNANGLTEWKNKDGISLKTMTLENKYRSSK